MRRAVIAAGGYHDRRLICGVRTPIWILPGWGHTLTPGYIDCQYHTSLKNAYEALPAYLAAVERIQSLGREAECLAETRD
jgi:hypothetical protein